MSAPIISLKDWDGHEINCVIHGSIEGVLQKIQSRPRLTFTAPPTDGIPEETYQKWLNELCEKSDVVFWNVPVKQLQRSFGVDPNKALGQIVWDKPIASPLPVKKIIYHHELIWAFGNPNHFISPVKSVWTVNAIQKSKHPAPFPIDLPGKAIDSCTKKGDLVFDPFGGSGTTAMVAKALGRNFITCDISKQYCTWMKERIEKTKIV
jgi:site-specific DNA-methyltransferase (adenine-specific)